MFEISNGFSVEGAARAKGLVRGRTTVSLLDENQVPPKSK
jgi:hypothetical protein